MSSVVILGAARTPIGRYGGTLRATHPAELGARAASAALGRAGIPPADVDEVLMGHGRQAGSGPNPARQVGRRAGLPDSVPAQTINQACASGLQAVALGAQAIQLGQSKVVLAGGIESMSRMPHLIDSEDARWGHKMGNMPLVDAMYRDGFFCPLSQLLMGQTAEVLARQYGITRDESDAYALESQRRAEAAIAAGRFTDEITPAPGRDAKGRPVELEVDEHPRRRHDDRRAAQTAAGVRSGRRTSGHHHGRLVVWHYRWRRGSRAREQRRSRAPRRVADGPGSRMGDDGR